MDVPLSMDFPGQEYWSGFPFTSPGTLSNPGIKLASPAWHADCLTLSHLEAQYCLYFEKYSTNELIYKAEILMSTENKLSITKGEEGGRRGKLGVWD